MFMGTFPPGGPPTPQQGVIPSLGIRPPMPMMMQPGFRGNLISHYDVISNDKGMFNNDIT